MPATNLTHQLPQTFSRDGLTSRFAAIRGVSSDLCRTLETEDYVIQSMPDVSPTKWHLAHVTWFFEAVILEAASIGYRPFHPDYAYLFNSYYNSLGERHCRPKRGFLSRPTVREVFAYREHVDTAMTQLIISVNDGEWERLAPLIEIGLQHEQQHQELMLMDIKHVFSTNPLAPAYHDIALPKATGAAPEMAWAEIPEGVHEIGHAGDGFSYDNERPRHRTCVQPALLGSRLVTEGEYQIFVEGGGYQEPRYWLSDGWAWLQAEQVEAPLYWWRKDDAWQLFTLSGMLPLQPARPVCHLSYYEADAYARWAGARLPREAEWEVMASRQQVRGNFMDDGWLHPLPSGDSIENDLQQLYGDVWEWTSSHYSPYPGFKPLPGPLGEYNGKFMANQFILRGGSCVTSIDHVRPSYRNFFPAAARWPFTGLRLARDV